MREQVMGAAHRDDKVTPQNTPKHPIGGDDLNHAGQLRLTKRAVDAGLP
jgi:hypothetical protein